MQTFQIEIKGKVQGVGFRPFIYKLALSENLKGEVWNQGGRVFIKVSLYQKKLLGFIEKIESLCPSQSIIESIAYQEISPGNFLDFKIKKSVEEKPGSFLFPTDLATCETCQAELHDSTKRRYNYPFTTCTNCGPRFSLMRAMPYDRERTSMSSFNTCAECKQETEDTNSHRCHSQTNSCPNCAIELSLVSKEQKYENLNQFQIIEKILEELKSGKTIAVKGIGGYLLLLAAKNKEAVKGLRIRKNRPNKPFALIYPSIEKVREEFLISANERNLLLSREAPIVLLKPKNTSHLTWVNGGFSLHGVMLPYAPILQLLAEKFKEPLVATSGNLSGTPIIYQDNTAFENLFAFADFILTHPREITTPLDDSLIKLTPINQQKITLRRSRGFAPNLSLKSNLQVTKNTVAFGGDLKATFTYADKNNVFTSQYLGNQEDLLSQYNFEETLLHYLGLLQANPEEVIVDAHPDYFTGYLGKMFAEKFQLPVLKVQHHKAHFASVLAEHNLFDDEVLGVIWDGTGYGEDGAIWGGEFFNYRNNTIERLSHFEYYDHFAGNSFAKQTSLPAFSLFEDYLSNNFWIEYFSESDLEALKRLRIRYKEVSTSSVGRWFDAVSFLLTGTTKNSFEGEAAMHLEDLALSYIEQFGIPSNPYYFEVINKEIKANSLKRNLIKDLLNGVSKSKIAAKFHVALASLIKDVAVANHYTKVALSGGVFQNGLLVDLTLQLCGEAGISLYRNEQLSPNDENISLGQIAYKKFIIEKTTIKKGKQNVFGSTR